MISARKRQRDDSRWLQQFFRKMADKLKTMSDEELRLERAAVMREYLELLAQIEKDRARADGGGETAKEIGATFLVPEVIVDVVLGGEERAARLAKLPLTDAILEYLSTCEVPKTSAQIVRTLESAGRQFDATDPVRAVRDAVKKLITINDDLGHVRWGAWYRKSAIKDKELLTRLERDRNGLGGRSSTEHSRRTKYGMRKAIEEGRVGAKRKITPELMERAKAMLAAGHTIKEIGRALDVSYQSLHTHGLSRFKKKKDGSNEAREEDPSKRNVVPFQK
jgi:hypothetical protein